MRFLPVLDVQGGIVVRALAGRRSEYRPLVSRLIDSTDPMAVAEAIRHKFDWSDLYVADLDAITAYGFAGNTGLYDRFGAAGFRLWLDAGIRETDDADHISTHADKVVVGLETLRDLAAWREIVVRLGSERTVFSLDLRDGRPLNGPADPLVIAEQVIAAGGRHLIVLDLARVGTGQGVGTERLCQELIRRHPGIDVHAGGGICGWEDVRRLEEIGVAGVLLASVLHDGSFTYPATHW
ncbi:MAG TPA: HisA/HisF-related TIM barrel protein [Gemmataceae bacterium]|jgi:phosphoribosylformimino-5-aminoimidazole carboxamide ribotide isomerase|nr:HisA/HisF-related TIM barrel protein [Gemmataceae bacterium]